MHLKPLLCAIDAHADRPTSLFCGRYWGTAKRHRDTIERRLVVRLAVQVADQASLLGMGGQQVECRLHWVTSLTPLIMVSLWTLTDEQGRSGDNRLPARASYDQFGATGPRVGRHFGRD